MIIQSGEPADRSEAPSHIPAQSTGGPEGGVGPTDSCDDGHAVEQGRAEGPGRPARRLGGGGGGPGRRQAQ